MSILMAYLNTLKASKAERIQALNYLQSHPEYHGEFFDLAVSPKAKRSQVYAAWVWELFMMEDLKRLEVYWNALLLKIRALTNPSMRRVHAKVIWYYLKDNNRFEKLKKHDKKSLISSMLEWVMTENKTAPLSFSIKILALFFQEFPKLKSDLKGLLIDSKRTFPKGVYPTIRMVFKD